MEYREKSDLVFRQTNKKIAKSGLRRPVTQRGGSSRHSRLSQNTDDWKMTATFVAVDFEDEWIPGITVNPDFWLRAWRSTWPFGAGLETGLFVRWRASKLDLIRRLAFQGLVRAVFVVPNNGEIHFPFEFNVIFGDRDQPQNLFQRSVESLYDGDAPVPAHRTWARCPLLCTNRSRSART